LVSEEEGGMEGGDNGFTFLFRQTYKKSVLVSKGKHAKEKKSEYLMLSVE
jgi:hypothetical protein